MTIIQWLSGTSGQLFSSACVIIILVLMMFMSVRLHKGYRKRAPYHLLIAAIPFMIVEYSLLVVLTYPGWSLSPWLHLSATMLQIVSFIIINFVFMKLYTYRSAQLRVIPFVIMISLALLIAAGQVIADPARMDRMVEGGSLNFLALDFYALVVTFLVLLDTKGAEMNSKYYGSLIVYFIYELARLADGYVFHGSVAWLLLLSHLLPIVYYTLLFLLLFDWVIERLVSTHQSSITDGLTGLYNRRHFSVKADQLMSRGKGMAVIFCDIDNFKKLNDTHGHHKADGVLKQVSEIIKEESTGIGAAGRYGGEELLACIATDRVKPDRVAESIRKRVEDETMVTISVGVSTSKDSSDVQEMIKQADQAMYMSKTTGKNKVSFFSTPTGSRSRAAAKSS
ncbi:GGDEF domain-containing protein [Paenibacillus sp. GCM10023252]|uniref:GGDEF domain-containing protein n=1 Tax=Paenibacillus sp. GCM10023252 TaxID=3252649 RepID=UPI00360F050B